jgi:hypothetical protein
LTTAGTFVASGSKGSTVSVETLNGLLTKTDQYGNSRSETPRVTYTNIPSSLSVNNNNTTLASLVLDNTAGTANAGVYTVDVTFTYGSGVTYTDTLVVTVNPALPALTTMTSTVTQGVAGATEKLTLTFGTAEEQTIGAGNITVTVGGVPKTVALTAGMSAADVASAVATAFGSFEYYTVTSDDADVIFTSTTANSNVEDLEASLVDTGSTHATMASTLTQGKAGVTEKLVLTFTAATGAGDITVTVGNVRKTVALTASMTATDVATAVAEAFGSEVTGYGTASADGADVTFTSTDVNSNVPDLTASLS